jgi:DNA-directed RNA polymerase alpha subunit
MKKHTLILKKFLRKVGLSAIRVRNAYDSESDMYNGIIYYNLNSTADIYENILNTIYKQKNHDIKISMNTYAFFHELGHILSTEEIEDLDNEMLKYEIEVMKLKNDSKLSLEKVMVKYRKLKLEKLADKYAYDFYKKYENVAIKLDKKLQALR